MFVKILDIRLWLLRPPQIVGTQAVFNVIMGERYKMVTERV